MNSKYLIVGGGMAAAAAAQGIREVDSDGAITIVGDEPDAPYDRPPLSKALWKDGSIDQVWRDVRNKGVDLRLGRRIERLDLERKRVTGTQGLSLTFDELLLATGARPRRLPFPAGDEVVYFRTLADYRHLRARAEKGRRIAVIGGGFIGSEIAAALALHGVEVVMIFPDSGIGSRIFPRPLSDFVTTGFRARGVEVFAEAAAVALEKKGEKTSVTVQRTGAFEETKLIVDAVVAGIGVEPNVELAQVAGLEVRNGIVVDEYLQTSRPYVRAAGDVAEFFSPALEKRLRVEHEDNANTMGRIAGRNMAGSRDPYRHLPFFYSDLFDMGYEAVGDTDSRLETFMDWTDPYREGVIYYLRDRQVRGVLLWNVWSKLDAARELIAERRPFAAEDLKGRLSGGGS